MTSLLATIVMVLPGFASYQLLRYVGPIQNREPTDYEKAIIGLTLNVPGMATAWGVWSILHHRSADLSSFEQEILKMPWFLAYISGALLCSLAIGWVWNRFLATLVERIINVVRSNSGRAQISRIDPWENFIGKEECVILRIYPIGEPDNSIIGQVVDAFMPGDVDKGVHLVTTSELKPWEIFLGEPERTYFDSVTKAVYEMYPPSAWEEAKRRAADSTNPSSSGLEEGESS